MTVVPTFVIHVVGLYGAIHTVFASQPIVVPKSVIAQVGTFARFNCTTVHNEPVYWITRPYGSKAINDIYIGETYLLDDYGTSGRFSVEVNNTLRRYDLLIKDVKQTDAGVYVCIDERGLGKKANAELIVWDTFICQEDQRQESYMGDNVFDLDQDTIIFTCKMNYRGNRIPQFWWSVGGKKLNGTQGTELGIASSSLILPATSKLDGSNVTCEAGIRDSSSEFTHTGVLWTSDTIRVKYAVMKAKGVMECPGVETILLCNPPCSYNLESLNGTQRCAVSYSTGTYVKWFHFYQSSVYSSETDSRHRTVVGVFLGVSCLVFIILGVAMVYLIKKLRHMKRCHTLLNLELFHMRLLEKQNQEQKRTVPAIDTKSKTKGNGVCWDQREHSDKTIALISKTL